MKAGAGLAENFPRVQPKVCFFYNQLLQLCFRQAQFSEIYLHQIGAFYLGHGKLRQLSCKGFFHEIDIFLQICHHRFVPVSAMAVSGFAGGQP